MEEEKSFFIIEGTNEFIASVQAPSRRYSFVKREKPSPRGELLPGGYTHTHLSVFNLHPSFPYPPLKCSWVSSKQQLLDSGGLELCSQQPSSYMVSTVGSRTCGCVVFNCHAAAGGGKGGGGVGVAGGPGLEGWACLRADTRLAGPQFSTVFPWRYLRQPKAPQSGDAPCGEGG